MAHKRERSTERLCCCPELLAGHGPGWQGLSWVIQHLGISETSLRVAIREFKDLQGRVPQGTVWVETRGFAKSSEHPAG